MWSLQKLRWLESHGVGLHEIILCGFPLHMPLLKSSKEIMTGSIAAKAPVSSLPYVLKFCLPQAVGTIWR